MARITMTSEVALGSPLREKLGVLPLFDYHCGPDDITMDIDYKHLFKRLWNTLIRAQGTTIDDVVITQQILKAHLLHNGQLTDHRINTLLRPGDRQDVKNMYDLLSGIAILPDVQADDNPAFRNTR